MSNTSFDDQIPVNLVKFSPAFLFRYATLQRPYRNATIAIVLFLHLQDVHLYYFFVLLSIKISNLHETLWTLPLFLSQGSHQPNSSPCFYLPLLSLALFFYLRLNLHPPAPLWFGFV